MVPDTQEILLWHTYIGELFLCEQLPCCADIYQLKMPDEIVKGTRPSDSVPALQTRFRVVSLSINALQH